MVLDFMKSFWPHYMLLLAFGKNPLDIVSYNKNSRNKQKLTENSIGVILKVEINQDFGFIVE